LPHNLMRRWGEVGLVGQRAVKSNEVSQAAQY